MAETYEQLLARATALGVQAPTTQQITDASKLITSPGVLNQPTSGVGSTAETNRLLGGTYFDPYSGSQLKEFTQADAIANAPNYSSTIPTTTLQTQTPMTIPQATPTNTSDALAAGADQFSQNLTTQQSQTEKEVSSLESEISSLLGTTTGRGAAQLSAEQAANVPGLKQELSNVNSQIQVKLAEFNKIQAQYAEAIQVQEGKTIPMNLIIGKQAEINRSLALQKNSYAADIGLLQAQASALQGNLQEAQRTADRAVDLKYEDANNLIEVKFQQLQLLQGKLNREEAKTADALALKYQADKDALSVRIAQEKDINNTNLNLLQQYPGAGVSLSNTPEQNAALVESYIQANGGSTDNGLMEISPGASLYDPTTGKFVATAPKSYAPSSNTSNNTDFTATEQKNYEAFKSEIATYNSKEEALKDLATNKSTIITKIGQAGYDLLVKDIEAYFEQTSSASPTYGTTIPLDLQKAVSSGGLSFEDDISNFLFE